MATCRTSSLSWVSLAILTMLPLAGASAQQASSWPPAGAAPAAAKAPGKAPAAQAPAAATRTRFIIGLDGRVDPRQVEIMPLGNPHRLLIDLPQMNVSLPNQPPANAPAGVVKSFQHVSPAPGKMRVVIDVTGPVVFEKSVET